jgi:hypothetical protein
MIKGPQIGHLKKPQPFTYMQWFEHHCVFEL